MLRASLNKTFPSLYFTLQRNVILNYTYPDYQAASSSDLSMHWWFYLITMISDLSPAFLSNCSECRSRIPSTLMKCPLKTCWHIQITITQRWFITHYIYTTPSRTRHCHCLVCLSVCVCVCVWESDWCVCVCVCVWLYLLLFNDIWNPFYY